MRPFWRSFWASIFAYVVLSIFVIVVINIVVFSVAGSFMEKKEFKINDNSYLELNLNFKIDERSEIVTTNDFDNPISKSYGIHQIRKILEKAKKDEKIKGIVLRVPNVNMGLSTIDNLRNCLKDFKNSGKFIIAYDETYSMGAFYLNSVADKIYLYPQGMVDFRGLGSEVMFFKKALDKLDVDIQIIRGKGNKFKGAVEPFMYEKMSSENKLQIKKLLDDVWKNMTHNIKDSRNISLESLNEIADSLYSYNATGSMKYQLVDDLIYEDQLDSIIRKNIGVNNEEKIHSISFKKYLDKNLKQNQMTLGSGFGSKKGNIAVVYAVGTIVSGKSSEENMGSATVVKAINKANNDSTIKAVVLRVNSPGGSALASWVLKFCNISKIWDGYIS